MSKITFHMYTTNGVLDVRLDDVHVGQLYQKATTGRWTYGCFADQSEAPLCSDQATVETAMSACRRHLGEKVVSKQQLLDEMTSTVRDSLATQFRVKLPVVRLGVEYRGFRIGDYIRMDGRGVADTDDAIAKAVCDDFARNAVAALAGLLFPGD